MITKLKSPVVCRRADLLRTIVYIVNRKSVHEEKINKSPLFDIEPPPTQSATPTTAIHRRCAHNLHIAIGACLLQLRLWPLSAFCFLASTKRTFIRPMYEKFRTKGSQSCASTIQLPRRLSCKTLLFFLRLFVFFFFFWNCMLPSRHEFYL